MKLEGIKNSKLEIKKIKQKVFKLWIKIYKKLFAAFNIIIIAISVYLWFIILDGKLADKEEIHSYGNSRQIETELNENRFKEVVEYSINKSKNYKQQVGNVKDIFRKPD